MPRCARSLLLLAGLAAGCDDRAVARDDPPAAEGARVACPGGHRLTSIAGAAADEAGQPLAGAHAQACLHTGDGAWLCLAPVTSDAGGRFRVEVPERFACVARAAVRVAADQGRPAVYCPVSGPPEIAFDRPFVLPALPPPTSLPPGDDGQVRTATFDDGLAVSLSPAQLQGGAAAYASLRAARLALDPRCVTDAVEGAYAFAPEVTATTPVAVTLPNVTALPAGTEVEVLVQGGLACLPGELDEGTLRAVGTATVSADGLHIATDAVLPCLGWLAYRRR
ncbi:MAG: hypothetical protein EOO75_17050 [Myxococcales bacterium]|nr:MAG: hypothetical protein EOO75_17050 [Myxococcales bacterium]